MSPVLFGTHVYCILNVYAMTVNSMLHTCVSQLSYMHVHTLSDAMHGVLCVMFMCHVCGMHVTHVWYVLQACVMRELFKLWDYL